jgi:hypothetical protein
VTEPTVPDGDAILALAAALLPEAAARSVGWSRELCRHVDHSGHDCAAYHAVWPYILLFGMATGPQRQREFYRAAVQDAVLDGGTRVLISGAADHNLAATVMWAYAMADAPPEIAVLDVCETPLRLSVWFADQVGARIETIAADILNYRAARPYDIIFAHSFIGLFAPDTWEQLFGSWRDALVPGGRVVMVHRVRRNAPDLIRFSASQAADLHARFLRHANARVDETGVAADVFPALIDKYVAHSAIYPLRSEQDLVALFERVGFRIDSLTLDPIDPQGPGTSPGPTLGGGVEYVKLVAAKL